MKHVRILSISDIHFGNTQLDPDQLANNFRQYVLSQFATIDLLIIAGDFFDTALSLSDTLTPSVISVMSDLLQCAAQHNVVVRILRGTFSHERTQGVYFQLLHTLYKFTNDLRYIDTIAVENIDRFDLRILYMPDDLPYQNSDAAMLVVQQKMQMLGWETVDYAIIHGYLDYTVPVGITQPRGTYDRRQFSFVQRYVISGHVHTPQMCDKFLNNGSFDRLAHGEEEPKGFILIDDDGITAHVRFVQNLGATPFITLDLCNAPTGDIAMQKFISLVECYPVDRLLYVRVFHHDSSWRHALIKFVRGQYVNVRLSVKAPKDKNMEYDSSASEQIVDFSHFDKPTELTLPTLIMKYGDVATKPKDITEDIIRQRLTNAAKL